MKRLVINACARKDSNTYKIFEELVKQKGWTKDDYEIVNLYDEDIPYVDQNMLDERFNNEYISEKGLVEKRLVEQFENSEQVIVVYPTWNWSIPAILKSYIDMIVISRRTFTMKGTGTVGLTNVKQAVIINTSGGPAMPKPIAYLFNINTDLFFVSNIMKIVGVKSVVKMRLGSFSYKYKDKDDLLKNDISKIVRSNLSKIN